MELIYDNDHVSSLLIIILVANLINIHKCIFNEYQYR